MTPIEMKGLWDLLGQTWGSKFYEQYGPQPNDAWGMALAHSSIDAAKYALTKLIEAGSPFAPTLPEFIVHARKWDRDCGPRQGDDPPLPPPDPGRTRRNLAQLRRLLDS
jgi:hypothetical protein